MTGRDDHPRDASIAVELLEEYRRAASKFAPFNSAHEGYAVLLEEVEELWELVRQKKDGRSVEEMREEAIEVGAMALRFVHDICERTGKSQ